MVVPGCEHVDLTLDRDELGLKMGLGDSVNVFVNNSESSNCITNLYIENNATFTSWNYYFQNVNCTDFSGTDRVQFTIPGSDICALSFHFIIPEGLKPGTDYDLVFKLADCILY